MGDPKIIELNTNHIPKGLVTLEILFDTNDVYLKYAKQSSEENTLSCNIGKEDDPKMIKISKVLLEEQRHKYVQLMK